jgi:hypothetical protein
MYFIAILFLLVKVKVLKLRRAGAAMAFGSV